MIMVLSRNHSIKESGESLVSSNQKPTPGRKHSVRESGESLMSFGTGGRLNNQIQFVPKNGRNQSTRESRDSFTTATSDGSNGRSQKFSKPKPIAGRKKSTREESGDFSSNQEPPQRKSLESVTDHKYKTVHDHMEDEGGEEEEEEEEEAYGIFDEETALKKETATSELPGVPEEHDDQEVGFARLRNRVGGGVAGALTIPSTRRSTLKVPNFGSFDAGVTGGERFGKGATDLAVSEEWAWVRRGCVRY